MTTTRDYDAIRALSFDGRSRDDAMRALVRALWHAHAEAYVSWVGFYVGPGEHTPEGETAQENEMLLADREPKPACSPIGMHGACGRSYSEKTTLIINDVRALGEGYVACDPRDLSELVVPLLRTDGTCWGVLDLDSFQTNAFSEHDASELHAALRRAKLTHGEFPQTHTIG